MNKKAKRRLVVMGGIIAIAMLVIVAIAGAGGSASSVTVADVATGSYQGKKVQLSGVVVADSIEKDGARVTFDIAPEDESGAPNPSVRLRVGYEGALPATFGAGVVAICTGDVDNPPFLNCTEMVTKCPSKYESAEGSLTVKGLLDQADAMLFEDTKVCGYVEGDVNDASSAIRFTIESQGATLNVVYNGGLDEQIADGVAVVVSGHLDSDGNFVATEQPAIDASITK